MSAAEAKTARDMAKSRLDPTVAKLQQALTDKSSRMIKKYQTDVQGIIVAVERKQLQYLTLAKISPIDPTEAAYLNDLHSSVAGVLDAAEIFMEKQAEEKEKTDHLQAVNRSFDLHYNTLMVYVEDAKARYRELIQQLTDGTCNTQESYDDEVNDVNQKLKDALKEFITRVQDLDNDEKIITSVRTKSSVEKEVRTLAAEAKKLSNEKGFNTRKGPDTSREDGSETGEAAPSSVFKPRRLDFPKFGGDIRAYIMFKKTFKEIVEDTNMYTDAQQAHIMQTECLSGEAKQLCENIFCIKEIWEKLEEVYHDPHKLIDMITCQITEQPEITNRDFQGLIKFVDLIDRANVDLATMSHSSVMDNPMTCKVIEAKLPDWVQKALAAKKNESPDDREKFSFLLEFLKAKRKEARSLSTMKQSEASKPIGRAPKGKGRVNAAVQGMKKKAAPVDGRTPWQCIADGCQDSTKHFLSKCTVWENLDVNGKGQIVKDKSLCILCFAPGHVVANCPRKQKWKKCDVSGCNKWHSRSIHGATIPGLVLTIQQNHADERVWLMVQKATVIGDKQDRECCLMWDGGASTSLVTFEFAERAGLKGSCCQFELTAVNENTEKFMTKLFKVPLKTNTGLIHEVLAYGIENIVQQPWQELPREYTCWKLSSNEEVKVDTVAGKVDILVGIAEVHLFPPRVQLKHSMALFSSEFGNGWFVAGKILGEQSPERAVVAAVTSKVPDFLTVESMGVEIPKRCKSCQQCKECTFKAIHLTWQENLELKKIEEGLTLDIGKKRWIAEYPFKEDPTNIRNNRAQAIALMKNLEKRLKKTSMLEDFNVQFNETVDRGVFEKVVDDDYAGPVNYISIVDTYKTAPDATTPIRLCMNSSLKYDGSSLNDKLMKGPAALNNLFGVLLGFRKHKIGFVKDISKFYQTIEACTRDKHLRRVVWRFGDETAEPTTYITTTVNFGDKPAGAVSQVALRKTAQMFRVVHPAAADAIISSTYVDDTFGGGRSRAEAVEMAAKMDEIVSHGGFTYKATTMTGDKMSDRVVKILGTGWDTEKDQLFVDTKINFGKKRKGIRDQADIEPEQVVEQAPETITKRMIWRVALGQYDVLGLTCPFMVRLKLMMRELVQSGANDDWDKPVPDEYRSKFLHLIQMLKQIGSLRFPRCLVAEECEDSDEAELLVLVDGSRAASCALAYVRWDTPNGSRQCKLICGKTRVAPLKRISIPRMELQAAVAGVRLAERVQEYSGLKFKRRYFFTDSSAALGMMRGNVSTYLEFVSTRVSEIKSKTDAQQEWYWIPSEYNISDLGTRETVVPSDMQLNSHYQDGMPWMLQNVETWPVLKEPTHIPPEEVLKSERVCAVILSHNLIDLSRFSSFSKAVRVQRMVNLALDKFSKRNSNKTLLEELAQAEEELFILAQQKMKESLNQGKYSTLRARLIKRKYGDGNLIVVSGRLGENLVIGYDKTELPLLENMDPLARLIIREAHERDHAGVDRTVQISRSSAWIVRGSNLARSIIKSCYRCKLRNKELEGQIMAPLPSERLPPAQPFQNVSLDLFGPFKIKDTVKRRVVREVYGIIFCCMATSAVHIESMDDYSTDSVLLSLRRFMSIRGTPTNMQSDPGTQVKAAGKMVELWKCSAIREFAVKRTISWKIVPTGAQHFNGLAESLIKSAKKCLKEVIGEVSMTKGELDTVFAEVAQKLNCRPLRANATEDTDSMTPITPNHLLYGRASIETPVIDVDDRPSLSKRLRFVNELATQFWNKWLVQVFHKLIPSSKWNVEKRNVLVDDVVLLKHESKVQCSYKLGRVVEAVPAEDGKVRRVTVEYVNPGLDCNVAEKKMRTERSVHGLVVIVAADEKRDVD